MLLESTGWKHLPYSGGLLDQPDRLMENVATIAWLSNILDKQGDV